MTPAKSSKAPGREKRAVSKSAKPTEPKPEDSPDSGEVWVNPDLPRLIKGPDHKLSTQDAERYWIERRRVPRDPK